MDNNISDILRDAYIKSYTNFPTPVCLLDGEIIVYCNPKLYSGLALSEKNPIIGQSILTYIPKEFHQIVLERIEKRKEGLQVQPQIDIRLCAGKEFFDSVALSLEIAFMEKRYTHVQFTIVTPKPQIHEEKLVQTKLNIGADLNFLNLLIDTIPNPIYYKNHDGIYIGCNQAFEQFMNVNKASILGKEPKNVPPIILANIYHDGDMDLIAKQGKEVYEGKARNGLGEICDVIYHKSVFFNPDGDTGGMVCTIIDITRQKQAKNALKESEVRVKLALEASMLGLWDLNLSKHTIYLSPEYYTILGYAPKEFKPRIEEWLNSFYGENNKPIELLSGDLRTVREKINGKEYKVKTRSGTYKWVLLKGKIVEQAISKYDYRLTGTIRDISAQKQAELALQNSDLRFRSILEASNDAIAILIEKHKIVYWNKKASEIFMTDAGSLNSKKGFMELVIPKEWAKLKQAFERTESSMTSEILEINLRIFDNTCLPARINISPLKIDGRLNFVLTIEDLRAERKAREEKERLEAQLRHAQKMETIGTLAGGIAHDFNNILTPIMGYTQMVMTDLPEDSELIEDLEHVLKAAQRAKELVKQILTFSRRLETEKVNVLVHLIVKEALSLITASIPSNIRIETKILSKDAAVYIAPTQLHQVVMNMCTNAYQAMKDKGGLLTILVDKVEHLPEFVLNEFTLYDIKYIVLKISDTGKGIPLELQERIFEPFFTTKGVGEGTGLGLSVAHGIIKDSNGAIKLESELGKGTQFTIYLPAVEAQPEVLHQTTKTNFDAKLKVLVVDDDKEVLDMMTKALRNLGFEVEKMNSSSEALELIKQKSQEINILVSDQIMPEFSGIELAKEFKALNSTGKVLLVTGFSDQITDESAKEFGVDKFMMKPIILDNLAEIIIQLLN